MLLSSHFFWEVMTLVSVVMFPMMCMWEVCRGAVAIMFIAASLVVFEFWENRTKLPQVFCLSLSVLLVAPGIVFGIAGFGVLWIGYICWRAVEPLCRGRWLEALALLSCNPCVVVFVHRSSPDALGSMVMFLLLTCCGHIVAAWSSSLWRLMGLWTRVLGLLSMAVLRLEFGLRRDEEGGFVSQLDHSLLDWAVVLLRRCVDVIKFPTALEWEALMGVGGALCVAGGLATEQIIVIWIVFYLKVRRRHFSIWCGFISSALVYVYASSPCHPAVVSALCFWEHVFPTFGDGVADTAHVVADGVVAVGEGDMEEDCVSSAGDSGGFIEEPPMSDCDSEPLLFNSAAVPMDVEYGVGEPQSDVGGCVGGTVVAVGAVRRSRRLAEAAQRRASDEVEEVEQVMRRGGRGVRRGRHRGRGRGRGRGRTAAAGDHLEEDVWKRFTPAEVDYSKCLARTFCRGRGGQCVHPPEAGSEFCARRGHAGGGCFGEACCE